MPITHAKIDPTADWTQPQLDARIALGQFPPGTLLADIVLPSDWNAGHTISLTSSDVGLGNVNNTSDANKPVSTAQQTALNLKANLASPTFTGTPAAPTAAAATNTTQLATTAFVMSEVASAVAGLLDFKGNTDCSANPNYPAASKGDSYVVSVAGKIGGASGKSVDVGDLYVANADNAGGTEASVGTSWFVLEHNLAGALLSANNLSDVASTSTARTNLGAAASGAATGSGLTMATNKLLGRGTAGTGALEEITLGTNLSLSGTTLNAAGGGGGGPTLLTTLTAATSASLIDTTSLTASYTSYEFRFLNLVPEVDQDAMAFVVSTDGGSTWKTDATYHSVQRRLDSAGSSPQDVGFPDDTSGYANISLSNVSDDGGLNGVMRVIRPDRTGYKTFRIEADGFRGDSLQALFQVTHSYQYRGDTAAINAIKFYMFGGNTTSGSIQIWGIP